MANRMMQNLLAMLAADLIPTPAAIRVLLSMRNEEKEGTGVTARAQAVPETFEVMADNSSAFGQTALHPSKEYDSVKQLRDMIYKEKCDEQESIQFVTYRLEEIAEYLQEIDRVSTRLTYIESKEWDLNDRKSMRIALLRRYEMRLDLSVQLAELEKAYKTHAADIQSIRDMVAAVEDHMFKVEEILVEEEGKVEEGSSRHSKAIRIYLFCREDQRNLETGLITKIEKTLKEKPGDINDIFKAAKEYFGTCVILFNQEMNPPVTLEVKKIQYPGLGTSDDFFAKYKDSETYKKLVELCETLDVSTEAPATHVKATTFWQGVELGLNQ